MRLWIIQKGRLLENKGENEGGRIRGNMKLEKKKEYLEVLGVENHNYVSI
jgi:hypothetical protein